MVLDEVHSLNGPEGDALQRIIMAVRCPILALSATIGNAQQLRDWFQSVQSKHMEYEKMNIIEGDSTFDRPEQIQVQEVFARFINLQRYVVTEKMGKDKETGKEKIRCGSRERNERKEGLSFCGGSGLLSERKEGLSFCGGSARAKRAQRRPILLRRKRARSKQARPSAAEAGSLKAGASFCLGSG
jgi:superfamily II RNA helicase